MTDMDDRVLLKATEEPEAYQGGYLNTLGNLKAERGERTITSEIPHSELSPEEHQQRITARKQIASFFEGRTAELQAVHGALAAFKERFFGNTDEAEIFQAHSPSRFLPTFEALSETLKDVMKRPAYYGRDVEICRDELAERLKFTSETLSKCLNQTLDELSDRSAGRYSAQNGQVAEEVKNLIGALYNVNHFQSGLVALVDSTVRIRSGGAIAQEEMKRIFAGSVVQKLIGKAVDPENN